MRKPNIIYILADDLGYGDVGCNNAKSRIPTPHLDRLAAEGMRFTDAHAGSSVCTPSRYHILTGRYCWRSRLKQGIVWEWDGSLIEPERRTVAQLLHEQSYHTACLGKWHLGWNWALKNGGHPNDYFEFGVFDKRRYDFGDRIDYSQRIDGGPIDRGFDSYFGVDVPNFQPYTWFENDRVTEAPTVEKPKDIYSPKGLSVPGWKHEKMIPEFTRRAVELIESQAAKGEPYFLYFPLTSPHTPIVPNEEFLGMSEAGRYGDFVCEVDWVVGQICAALERSGTAENTLLIFTSDNGPEDRTPDGRGVFERARELKHYSMGGLRGIKRDVWEGGHRVPFIARWPGVVPAGRVCEQLVSLGDFMATCAEITGTELVAGEAEDSVSMLPLLEGNTDRPTRDFAIHHSAQGTFAVRKGDWVYIEGPSGGDRAEPEWFKEERGYTSHDYPAELFHLRDDLSERKNCYAEQPEVVAELRELLAHAKGGDADPGAAGELLSE